MVVVEVVQEVIVHQDWTLHYKDSIKLGLGSYTITVGGGAGGQEVLFRCVVPTQF